MKSRKVYIGIAAITVSLIIVIASIFYIKANQKDVEIAKFEQSASENTKEAMKETEVNTDEKSEETQETQEEVKEEEKEEEKKEAEPEPVKEIVVTEASGTLYVTADSLNVRSGPDTSYSKVGSLTYASEIEVNGKSDNWYRISYNNKVGFVREDYLSSSKPEPKQRNEENYEYEDDGSVGSEVLDNLIIINSRYNTLRFYQNGSLVASYSCATGASGTPTPQGKFAIFEKLVNRPYGKTPDISGDSPNNALGRRWMQFKSGGYAIHGTNAPSSIGKHASHGCVRMHNEDVIELYSMVPMGTTVIVKNTSASDRNIAAAYGIYVE